MKKTSVLLVILLQCLFLLAQNVTINYATIAIWEGGDEDVFYTDNDFNDHNFGELNETSELYLKSGQLFVAKTLDGNIIDADMYYRIYKVGDTPGEFVNVNLPWHSEWLEDWTHQLWWNDSPEETNLNILDGITPGNYVIEVYFQAEDGTSTILYHNNATQNFKAYFTYSVSSKISNSQQNSATVFDAYPNPADDKISIKFSQPVNVESIKMISNNSDVVYQGGRSRGVPGTPIDIDIEDMDAGTYFIRVQTDSQVSVQRIVIAK